MGSIEGPALRVVHGDPQPADLAALVAVLHTRGGAAARPAATSAWTDRRALLRRPLPHGEQAWRYSARPS